MLLSKEIIILVNLAFFPTIFSEFWEPTNVDIQEAPFIAAVYSNNVFVCAGTIVTKKYILTAADCVRNLAIKDIFIKVGQQNTKNGKLIKAKNVNIAPKNKISRESEINQISAIELENPLIFNENISNIDIISNNIKNHGAYIVGWTCCPKSRRRLEKVNIELLPTRVCSKEAPKYLHYVDSFYYEGSINFCFSGMRNGFVWKYYGSPLILNGKLAGIKILNKNDNSLYVDLRHFDNFLKKLKGPGFPTPITDASPTGTMDGILRDVLKLLQTILKFITKITGTSSEEQ